MAADLRMSLSGMPSGDRQRSYDLPRRPDASVPVSRGTIAENGRPDVVEKSGIIGPSFLGLSDEPEDDTAYLMEDESSSGSGLRKLVLLVILAAIAGLVFVQYRSSLHAKPKSPAPAQPSPTVPQSQRQPATAAPGLQNQGQQGPAAAAGQPSPQTGAPANSYPTSAGPSQDSQPTPDASSPPTSETLLLPQMSATNVAEKSTDPSAAPDNAGDMQASDAARKAFDAPVPVEQKPSPLLVRAQQFLHGQGVKQNCEQGMIYLRAAAQKNEPAAAVQMGALYASGRCVHQDRVMAYRWFNSAHELEPANQWIQRNMDLLWGQMTDQERRLAAY